MKRNGYQNTENNLPFSGEERQDGALRIMEALSGVDAELLERSEASAGETEAAEQDSTGSGRKIIRFGGKDRGGKAGEGRRKLWKYARPWAAVLCLAVVGVLGWNGYQLTRRVGENTSGGNRSDMALYIESADAGADAAEDRMEEAAPRDAEWTEGIGEEGTAAGGEDRQNGTADSKAQQAGNGEGKTEQMQEGEKRTEQPEQEGTDSDNRSGDTADGSAANQYTESTGVSGQDKNDQEQASEETMIDLDGCPSVKQKNLTEKEARNQKELGPYLPGTLPQGYAFEEAFSNLDQEEANLAVIWTRGLDSIIWRVVKAEAAPETVDIDRPETYDLRLYEVPLAESVPGEYRQSVDNPVFAWEDFSLEIVESRMMSRSDRGDTDTPRGNFAVLCQDNIVIYFSGRGTAEEIWELFSSVEALN